MKYFLPFALFMLLVSSAAAQINVTPKDKIPTGILYDLSYQFSGMENYDGADNSPMLNRSKWYRLYYELSAANVADKQFQHLSQIKIRAKAISQNDEVPLGLLFYEYNFLLDHQKEAIDSRGNLDISEMVPGQRKLFAAAALHPKTYNGNRVVFHFDNAFVFTNQMVNENDFAIDFDDGNGWRSQESNNSYVVSYQTTGIKNIHLKMTDASGESYVSKFEFEVIALQTPVPDATWSVTADLDYNGVTTSGDVYILYGNGNTQITKPVVISEGIDFEDENNWEALYALLNQQNLLEDLRAEGFDIMVLNFNNAVAYIQSNAFLMKKVIEMVNDTIDYSTEIIVVGPSMGGLVTRYALTYMENNGIDHNCNLWFSFEAPHRGANLPLGLQYELLFFSSLDPAIEGLLNALNEPAPRQMLVYHLTDPPSGTAGPDALFDDFQTEIASIGDYPQLVKKVAISNGRADGVGQPYGPGNQVIDYNYNSFLVNIKGNVWAVEQNTTGQIFEGLIQPLFGSTDQLNVTVFSPQPYDNSPGGISPTFAEIAEMEAPFGDIIALHDNHSFIPTVSGLDIETDNLFYNIAGDAGIMSLTPFDTIFWAADNYDHRFISQEMAAFVMEEIMAAQTKTHDIQLAAGWNDLSSYLNPTEKNIADLLEDLGEDLIIMYHFEEIYWPEEGINTIGEWDYQNGYLVKLQNEKSMSIKGMMPESQSISIVPGWNLIPVLSSQPVEITALLGSNVASISIIKEGVGLNVFWPGAGVQTLQFLLPGKAYYLHATESFTISFGQQ
jgi:hypothetical protein